LSENPFPDYTPKLTKDTIFDYHYEFHSVLKNLGIKLNYGINDIDELFGLLMTWKEKAVENPGRFIEGNMILGADAEQYKPSDEELVESHLGSILEHIIIENREKNEGKFIEKLVDKLVEKLKKLTKSKELSFKYIEIYHMDVMGSGRFFYASKPEERKIF